MHPTIHFLILLPEHTHSHADIKDLSHTHLPLTISTFSKLSSICLLREPEPASTSYVNAEHALYLSVSLHTLSLFIYMHILRQSTRPGRRFREIICVRDASDADRQRERDGEKTRRKKGPG
jgi:hypothetical protein